jgi:hypothetical protein
MDKTRGSVILPGDAVSHDRKGDFVYVAQKSDDPDIYLASRRQVTLGELTPGGYPVKEGLTEGDLVITAGLRFLSDGRKVRLLNPDK